MNNKTGNKAPTLSGNKEKWVIKNSKELIQLGIFNENINSIKIIEWPELLETNVTDRLELHISYANDEKERNLILKGKGKWKEFDLNEL